MSRTIVADGIAEDLIRAFVQTGCAELHMKTLVEKYNAQLENGLIDLDDNGAVLRQTDKITAITEEMNNLAELRRSLMLRLFDMFDGDKDFWCLTKHLGIGSYTLFEAYQASEDDSELYTLALEANKRFIWSLSQFIGMDPVDCASCFADLLKAKGKEHGGNNGFTGNKKPV